MLTYLRRLLPDVFRVFTGTVRMVIFWVVTVGTTLALAINPAWTVRISLQSFPQWYALPFFGGAFLFALLRAAQRDSDRQTERLKKFEEQQPVLVTSVQEQDGQYYVVVQNDGGKATVWADVHIAGPHLFPTARYGEVHQGYWQSSRRAETVLLHGQRDKLHVGGVQYNNIEHTRDLSLYFCDPNSQGQRTISQGWHLDQVPEPPKPHVFVEITLHADPAANRGAVSQYFITLDGLLPHGESALPG